MDTANIDCVCGSIFHGLTRWAPHPKSKQGSYMNLEQYIQRRNRTIEAIHQLNFTLAPSLDIRPVPASSLVGYSRAEHLRPICSSAEKESQTELTGEVQPTGIDLTREAEIFTSIAERVKQKKYLCGLCGSEYQWKSSVYRHVKSDHQVNQETCEYCHVPFSGKSLLYAHLRQRREQGWCRVSRGIKNTANKTVVAPPVNHGMPALYKSIDMLH